MTKLDPAQEWARKEELRKLLGIRTQYESGRLTPRQPCRDDQPEWVKRASGYYKEGLPAKEL